MNKKLIPLMLLMLVIIIVSIIFAIQGVRMHDQVAVEEAKFHSAQADYWSQAKSIRDAAPTGSKLNAQLVEIRNFPSELLRLKLVGVGKILTGIFVLLLGILIALLIMPKRFGQVLKENKPQGP